MGGWAVYVQILGCVGEWAGRRMGSDSEVSKKKTTSLPFTHLHVNEAILFVIQVDNFKIG